MSFLKKMFGERPEMDPAQDPNMIRVYDAYGRERFIAKQDWRTKVLPGTLQSNWQKPDELYNIIVGALNDGFCSDVLGAAEQLYKIDVQPARGACVWGIVLMEENRLDDAEKVFRDFMGRHGEDGVILTNLAKVYSRRKEDAQAEDILWRGLQLDPNQDNGMAWYYAIYRERGGEAAAEEALRRVATIPGSWRAQLWLARAALHRSELVEACKLYRQSLASAGNAVPADLLMQMSGDLGKAGHLSQLVSLTVPHFNAAVHGLQVGNNLIKALLDLGQIEAAREILQDLFAQNRPDWKEALSFWATELAKAHLKTTLVEATEKLNVAMLTIDGAVWLPDQSPAHELFPAPTKRTARLCFLGSSVETAGRDNKIRHQMSEAPGRFSRGLPLLLAEQVRFNCDSYTRTLVPWVQSTTCGFALSGRPWADADAAQHAKAGEPASDYVIVTHLKTTEELWTTELRMIRSADSKCLATAQASFPRKQIPDGAESILRNLFTLLARHAGIKLTSPCRHYMLPPVADLTDYLLRLDQLLAVRCSGLDNVPQGFLNGEREIIDGNINLCLNNPKNPTTRILLLQTMKGMKRVLPEILSEYQDKLQKLHREHPLDEASQRVCQRMLNDLLHG